MVGQSALKAVDIVVALRLAEVAEEKYEDLATILGISPSMAHASVRRLRDAGLLRPQSRVVNRLTLLEFLEHGVRYAFPARPGGVVRGVPTAHAAPPLAGHIVAEDAFVWPAASGPLRGRAVAPLYPHAVGLPARSPTLY
jgi:DNA-binding Lrp family transcriptional regulator